MISEGPLTSHNSLPVNNSSQPLGRCLKSYRSKVLKIKVDDHIIEEVIGIEACHICASDGIALSASRPH